LFFIDKYCNKSSTALELGFSSQLILSCRSLLASLCLMGIGREFNAWRFNGKKDFNFIDGIKNGLQEPMKIHSPALHIFKDRADDNYTFKDYMQAVMEGSLGDRYHLFTKGYSANIKINIECIGFFFNKVFHTGVADNLFKKVYAAAVAASFTAAYDYMWGNNLLAIGKTIGFMFRSVNQLQHRLVDNAQFCKAMLDLSSLGKKYTFIGESCLLNEPVDSQLMGVLKELSSSVFSRKSDYLYSRGKVLCMHKKLEDSKKYMVPVLQSIALLDAYCSIAQLYIESQDGENKFSFAHFDENDRPYVAYKGLWLALLPQETAIKNDFCMGLTSPDNAVFTGPNGGGKSALLKACGVAVVLAQSWTIMPAECGQQTVIKALRTGIATHENLSQGLSTFMAEKKSMEYLYGCIQKGGIDNHQLILIDEPYKGTVDKEAAKRIYDFGLNIAQTTGNLVCIATHVKKPIVLADQMPDSFANYHVAINEEPDGVFKRLFTVKRGPAAWWFEDEAKRARFVDWISTEINDNAEKNQLDLD
jgi:hypothetical protein